MKIASLQSYCFPSSVSRETLGVISLHVYISVIGQITDLRGNYAQEMDQGVEAFSPPPVPLNRPPCPLPML